MGKGHFNLPLVNERAKMQASFMFGDDLYQEFEKRDGKILNGDISLNKFLVMQN